MRLEGSDDLSVRSQKSRSMGSTFVDSAKCRTKICMDKNVSVAWECSSMVQCTLACVRQWGQSLAPKTPQSICTEQGNFSLSLSPK